MSEALKIEGKIGELKRTLKGLELKFQGLKLSMRDLLDVTERDPACIKTEIIAEQALDLDKARGEIVDLRTEISELKRILGR
ncbi:MAG: hypothetical protein ABFD98_15685 [Syntrophobacteraceae bacterium]|nr:hypothetical protein [Desulfobacteraceae bacterium]